VARIRAGDASAWQECIARFEGRLLAFVDSRLRDHAASEDVVQETFLGFLTALPNYHDDTPLESFLFAIAAHKLTDHLRRQGRRPALPLETGSSSSSPREAPADARARMASSLARSREQQEIERKLLAHALRTLINQWRGQGNYERLKCIELLFVLGWGNKQVATQLGLTEQAVANHKSYVISRLMQLIARESMSEEFWQELGD
ncbi:MAG: RNA polymerase sigma factor, partial [Planctomycetaceae bacterium]